MLVDGVYLIIHPLLLALSIHEEDVLLPFQIGAWDPDADICNEGCVVGGDPGTYCTYQGAPFAFVVSPSCQFGILFQLLEVEHCWVIAHVQLPHPLLVNLLNSWVLELFIEPFDKVCPAQVSISWDFVIVLILAPILLPMVHLINPHGSYYNRHAHSQGQLIIIVSSSYFPYT